MQSLNTITAYIYQYFDYESATCYSMGESEQENKPKPLFGLGQIVGILGALQALIEADQNPVELLLRHVTGDWGDLKDEDQKENEISVEEGFRILSAYNLELGEVTLPCIGKRIITWQISTFPGVGLALDTIGSDHFYDHIHEAVKAIKTDFAPASEDQADGESQGGV